MLLPFLESLVINVTVDSQVLARTSLAQMVHLTNVCTLAPCVT